MRHWPAISRCLPPLLLLLGVTAPAVPKIPGSAISSDLRILSRSGSAEIDGDVFVDTQCDNIGRAWKTSAPYRSGSPVWTETEFDDLDRPVEITNPDSTTITMAYTANTVTGTDEDGVQRRSTYNALGQLILVEEPDPDLSSALETTYAYTASGLLTGVAQGSQTRSFSYNWLGDRLSETHPEEGTTTYTHDAGGLVLTRTDARSKVATYTHDDIGRPLTIAYSDSTPDVAYTYDEGGFTGFLTAVDVDGVIANSLEYNSAGQLSEENVVFDGVSGTFTTQYGYDWDGKLVAIVYPSGRVVTRTYDSGSGLASGRLSGLGDYPTSAAILGSVGDNAAGQITARTLGGSISETRTFNSRLQLTNITASVSSAPVLDLDYGYTATGIANTGRIRSRTDSLQPEHSVDYTFDAIGRLTAIDAANSSWGVSWSLDRYGNRTAQTPSGLASGRVGSQSIAYSGNKNTGWTYDAAGNATNDGTHSYTWDAENSLVQVDSSSNQYAYDAGGRRVRRTSDGATTYYLYGLTGLQSEFSTSTALSSATASASTDRLAYRVGEPTGTAVLLLDGNGVVRESSRVFPFGEPWQEPVASANTEAFTTYQHDDESGLDYAMARYYATRSGRFMTSDPGHVGAMLLDPQSWNAYAYVSNDPINATDPDGRSAIALISQFGSQLTQFVQRAGPAITRLISSAGQALRAAVASPAVSAITSPNGQEVIKTGFEIAPKLASGAQRMMSQIGGPGDEETITDKFDEIYAFHNGISEGADGFVGRALTASADWGQNRLVKELHDQGFVLERATKSADGLLYRNARTGEEMRIMPRPSQKYRNDPPAKHKSAYYYRYRTGPDQPWGPHTSIPEK